MMAQNPHLQITVSFNVMNMNLNYCYVFDYFHDLDISIIYCNINFVHNTHLYHHKALVCSSPTAL